MPFRAPELFDVQSPSVITEKTDSALPWFPFRHLSTANRDAARVCVCVDPHLAVWSLGCTLYAMAFGYSPFEVEFSAVDDKPRVVECSHLRVIAKVAFPRSSAYSATFQEFITCVGCLWRNV